MRNKRQKGTFIDFMMWEYVHFSLNLHLILMNLMKMNLERQITYEMDMLVLITSVEFNLVYRH